MEESNQEYHIYKSNLVSGFGVPYIITAVVNESNPVKIESYLIFTKKDEVYPKNITVDNLDSLEDVNKDYPNELALEAAKNTFDNLLFEEMSTFIYDASDNNAFKKCENNVRALIEFGTKHADCHSVFEKLLNTKNDSFNNDLRSAEKFCQGVTIERREP